LASQGPTLAAFEEEWAAYCGTAEAVGISSGTAALQLALRATEMQAGDEVIAPAMTYVATAFSVSHIGAIPVFTDVDERTFTLDPEAVEAAVTPRTTAVVPVHLYGQTVDEAPSGSLLRL
jgi:dTDP-4-amino-4,6-dideoxygalactose transaminase